jgi:beta-mannosidase
MKNGDEMLNQSLAGGWQFRQAGTQEWLPAQVPGGVHTDLLAVSRIPDPFVGDNEKRVRWVAESDWEYRRTFSVPPDLLAEEHIFLVCDGLDTLAEVKLNGQVLGKTDNMFRQYRWEVKSLLRRGENEVAIIFASAVKYVTAKMAERPLPGVSQAIPGGPHVRKAPCQFGWDWGPMLPPIGIWKDIRLEGRSAARLDDVHVRQQHQSGKVTLSATVTVERWQNQPLTVAMHVTGPDEVDLQAEAPVSDKSLQVVIASPQLWWPNGYGAQPLYQVEVTLKAGGRVCDRRTYQVGLRTLELRQQDDEWGKSFTFVVNGVPIFAKGSDWIPADSFPTRLSDEHLEGLIRSAADTYQNMLRVWGGGFYEEDRFYDLCDKYGILVWQDGVFACSIYPLDEAAFVGNVRQEIVENVRRLRHRASLALWCGNNEMEWGWESWGWAESEPMAQLKALAEKIPFLKRMLWEVRRDPLPGWKLLRDAYDKFFHATLPEWIAREDPDTPYWPSSPSSNTPFQNANASDRGDAHYWDVWHGRQPFTAYRTQYPRFMSEFGFQSLPPLETIRTYADQANWNMTSYIMEHHQRSGSGNGLMIAQMTDAFRTPKDFPSLVYLSMVLQAEGIRYGVEHWRRAMHRISGTLYWQLNDCWPVASWSSLDFFGRWKALHYAARRFYAPLMLSIYDDGTKMGIHVTSDLAEAWQGKVCWTLETIGGQVLASGEEAVLAAPQADTHVRTLDFADRVSEDPPATLKTGNSRGVIFTAELWKGDRRVALAIATFVPNKHLTLTDPGLAVDVRQEGGQLVFEAKARSLARFVELALAGADVVFSDNYFDVPAGRSVAVTCPQPQGWTLEQARRALRVRSLYNSFA